MTLTEQWKKGELKEGWYYIECIDMPERWIDIDYYRNDCYEDEGFCKGFFDHNDWRGIEEVLAPVPSYEEWNQLRKFLEEFNALDVAKENQQLKELLYSLKCCLTSENIEPQIRVEKSLAKIEEFSTDGK